MAFSYAGRQPGGTWSMRAMQASTLALNFVALSISSTLPDVASLVGKFSI
jgi:hypothetical protein